MAKFKVGDIIINKYEEEIPKCEGCVMRVIHIDAQKKILDGIVIKVADPTCNYSYGCFIEEKYAKLSYEHCLYYKMKVRRND